jgi:hypothetical protein
LCIGFAGSNIFYPCVLYIFELLDGFVLFLLLWRLAFGFSIYYKIYAAFLFGIYLKLDSGFTRHILLSFVHVLIRLFSAVWVIHNVWRTTKSSFPDRYETLVAAVSIDISVILNAEAGFAPGSVHVGFVVDKVALGQVFLRVLRFSPLNISFYRRSPNSRGEASM